HDGHRVQIASNASQALETFQRSQFDLVITDKTMPGMDGQQLAMAIKKLRPKQQIILLTGFTELSHDGIDLEDIDRVLAKPISLTLLRQALADVVAQSASDNMAVTGELT